MAVRNTIVHALINRDFLDFFMNWHKHLQKLKVGEGLHLTFGLWCHASGAHQCR